MGVSILIAKKEGMKICTDDYKVGWLIKDDREGLWMIWGSCKDLKNALNVARDVIKEKGKREIYYSDTPLSKNLTLLQVLNLENITKSIIKIKESNRDFKED